MARRAVAGVVSVEILDEHLKDVPIETLSELASVAECDELLELRDGAPDVTTVLEIMTGRARDRAAKRQAALEAQAAAEENRLASEQARAENHKTRMRSLKRWISDHGTDEQKDRMAEGLLPEVEMLADVTDEIIDVTEDAYDPLRKEHACDCEKGCAGSARFLVGPPISGLDARQFATLQRIREQAPDDAKVEVRLHRVHCPECSCAPLSRLSAQVSVEWEGWRLVREYALK
jgi:hypothetical protein